MVVTAEHLSEQDLRLLAAIEDGLPLVRRPYLEIGRRCGLTEEGVIAALKRMLEGGVIKRFGVVVRHHELGYKHNAMVVWDIPDGRVDEVGACFATFDFITLCYQRPRRLPGWPYNLFCMVHGKERQTVLDQVSELADACGARGTIHEILFSKRRFKQRGAVYGKRSEPQPEPRQAPRREPEREPGAAA